MSSHSDVRACACGYTADLADTMDAYPPIPYSAWPERWRFSDEGRWLTWCPRCDEELDAEACAVALGEPRDYPWRRQGELDSHLRAGRHGDPWLALIL